MNHRSCLSKSALFLALNGASAAALANAGVASRPARAHTGAPLFRSTVKRPGFAAFEMRARKPAPT